MAFVRYDERINSNGHPDPNGVLCRVIERSQALILQKAINHPAKLSAKDKRIVSHIVQLSIPAQRDPVGLVKPGHQPQLLPDDFVSGKDLAAGDS